MRKLLDLIDMLPSASRTREAILNDPEAAAYLAEQPEPEDGDWSPRISEWSFDHALMYDQRALLVAILQTLRQTAGEKRPKKIEPLPRPRTLVDELREQKRERDRRARVDDMKFAFGFRPG
ncbi:MAG TPA: hypothetical protein VGF17_16980 [Phytomonospora sp.]|nr:hypothetical protein [Streptomycetaceae bacterium]